MRTSSSTVRVCGLLRVRNEELLLPDTLKHMASFCDEIFVYDDASTDRTWKILCSAPEVTQVIRKNRWNPNQIMEQAYQRHVLFEVARASTDADYLCYMDCDERIEFDLDLLEQGVDAVALRLYDFYLTHDDRDPYDGGKLRDYRQLMGPEYRDIIYFFKPSVATYDPTIPNNRQPKVAGNVVLGGSVQHFGKAISIDEWERKCDHYIKNVPNLADRWLPRKGKAIHTSSDFGRPLITWEERGEKGVPLTE